MAILAQQWLNSHMDSPYDDELRRALMEPINPNKLNEFASRLVYHESLETTVHEHDAIGLDCDMIERTTKLSAKYVWVELPDADDFNLRVGLTPFKIGVLFKRPDSLTGQTALASFAVVVGVEHSSFIEGAQSFRRRQDAAEDSILWFAHPAAEARR